MGWAAAWWVPDGTHSACPRPGKCQGRPRVPLGRTRAMRGASETIAARKRGRAVECTGLENRRCRKTSVSSNLTLSARFHPLLRSPVLRRALFHFVHRQAEEIVGQGAQLLRLVTLFLRREVGAAVHCPRCHLRQ